MATHNADVVTSLRRRVVAVEDFLTRARRSTRADVLSCSAASSSISSAMPRSSRA